MISAISTTVIMVVLMLLMLFLGFSHQIPPPEPKKVIMIELDDKFGGGNHQRGGSKGNVSAPAESQAKAPQSPQTPAAPNYVTDASSPVTTEASPVKNDRPKEPQVNSNALFKGSHNGTQSGSGLGRGNGLGQGDDTGSGMGAGKGIGYGEGSRPYRRSPDLVLPVSEVGQVSVELEVAATGQVVSARIINTSKYPTTVTSASVQQECLNKAKKISYREGEHELRIIVFK